MLQSLPGIKNTRNPTVKESGLSSDLNRVVLFDHLRLLLSEGVFLRVVVCGVVLVVSLCV